MKREYDMSRAKHGAIISTKGKTRITLYVDNNILNHFRKKSETQGKGYQTLINDALRVAMEGQPIDSAKILRRIIREELKVINK